MSQPDPENPPSGSTHTSRNHPVESLAIEGYMMMAGKSMPLGRQVPQEREERKPAPDPGLVSAVASALIEGAKHPSGRELSVDQSLRAMHSAGYHRNRTVEPEHERGAYAVLVFPSETHRNAFFHAIGYLHADGANFLNGMEVAQRVARVNRASDFPVRDEMPPVPKLTAKRLRGPWEWLVTGLTPKD